MGSLKVADSGVAEGSCFFRDGEDHEPVEHGYLFDADGELAGYLVYDLSKRKVVQCEIFRNSEMRVEESQEVALPSCGER